MSQATNLIRVTVPQLLAGDIVHQHGGQFLVLTAARASRSHLPQDGVGPSDCAVAEAVCIAGQVPGYFKPGDSWSLQGNHHAHVSVQQALYAV